MCIYMVDDIAAYRVYEADCLNICPQPIHNDTAPIGYMTDLHKLAYFRQIELLSVTQRTYHFDRLFDNKLGMAMLCFR